jgi:hypothetical protein
MLMKEGQAVLALLGEIVNCPNVEKCLRNRDVSHPCREIVTSQKAELSSHHVPEPWSGDLAGACMLFLSSNPSIDKGEEYPTRRWSAARVTDFFDNRFGGSTEGWVKDELYPLMRGGSHRKESVRFWAAVRARAAELITDREVRPGIDYAISEVVHCKSTEETGVPSALRECSDRYLRRVIEASGARLVICLGTQAAQETRRMFGVSGDVKVWGPVTVGTKARFIAFLPHPNARQARTFAAYMPDDLDRLRTVLRRHWARAPTSTQVD